MALRHDGTGLKQPVAEKEPWSCVDYVDKEHPEDKRATKPNLARAPGGRALSNRFGVKRGHDERHGDGGGTCRKRTVGSGIETETCDRDITFVRTDDGLGEAHKWYTGKKTNGGWPGTGKGR